MIFDPIDQLDIMNGELRNLNVDIEFAFRELQNITKDIHNLERLRKSIKVMIEDLEKRL